MTSFIHVVSTDWRMANTQYTQT